MPMTGHYACRRSGDAARRIKTKISAIAGAAVVLWPDGLSLFDDLRRWEAAQQDGEDLRNLPFPDLKAALARHGGGHPVQPTH
jgi:hypothetical protein